jgi:hypothetical protein
MVKLMVTGMMTRGFMECCSGVEYGMGRKYLTQHAVQSTARHVRAECGVGADVLIFGALQCGAARGFQYPTARRELTRHPVTSSHAGIRRSKDKFYCLGSTISVRCVPRPTGEM